MIDVIIVSYNTKELLEENLNSIFKSNFKDFNVFVVDNASSDDSIKMIKKRFHKVNLISNKKNVGFAKAVNQAIKISKSEYIQIMHSDVVVEKDTFSKVFGFMREYDDIAALGCQVKHPDGKIFPSAHKFPRPIRFVLEVLPIPKFLARNFDLYGLFMRQMDFDIIQPVDIVASAFLLLRRKAVEEIGYFDEEFTNWTSEWDLCYRFKKNGWEIMYYNEPEVVHYECYAPKNKLKIKEVEYKRGKGYVVADKVQQMLFLFYRKHYSKIDFEIFRFLSISNLLLKSGVKSFTFYKEDSRNRIKSYFKTIKVCIGENYKK